MVQSDYASLETVAASAIKDKQPFERLVASKEDLLGNVWSATLPPCIFSVLKDICQYNKFKVHLINSKVPDGTSTTVYRCGPMIDLCVGPHIPHTGRIKAFMVTKVSFRGGSKYTLTLIVEFIIVLLGTMPITTHCRGYMGSHSQIKSN